MVEQYPLLQGGQWIDILNISGTAWNLPYDAFDLLLPQVSSWSHILRPPLCQIRTERLGTYCRIHRGKVGHQPLVACYIFPRQNHCLAHSRVLCKPRFDLAQFYPESAYLYLKIIATNK